LNRAMAKPGERMGRGSSGRRIARCWLLVNILAAAGSLALAGETAGKAKRESIFITSDQMEVDRKKNTITYRGRVVTVQGEMTMKSERLTAYYHPDMKQLKEVIAEGKIRVAQGDRVATGAKATYNDRDRTIVLTGNPVVRQGKSQVSGSRITFFIGQDRSVVEGGNQRVKATVVPEDLARQEKEGKGRDKK